MTVAFLLTSLIVVASPGTGVLFTLTIGLSQGARRAAVAAFGCTLGIVPHLAAALLGVAAVLHASALAFQTLKFTGVAYLLFMAWRTLRMPDPVSDETAKQAGGSIRLIGTAVLINLLNPKLSIFFLAFLPQFLDQGDPSPLAAMTELSLVFMAMTLGVFVLYGVFAAAVRRHVLGRPRVMAWLKRSFAAAFVALGAKLALSER